LLFYLETLTIFAANAILDDSLSCDLSSLLLEDAVEDTVADMPQSHGYPAEVLGRSPSVLV